MPYRTVRRIALAALAAFLAACGRDQNPTGPSLSPEKAKVDPSLAPLVRALAAARGVTRMPRPPHVREALSRLGQVLAFDKILSGNRDISCMTCHLPSFATGDGRSLSVGQGATGLGPARLHPGGAFIPRNAPSLFNITALQTLFWDGRVSKDDYGHFHTPAGAMVTGDMERVMEYGPASAIGLFPVQSREEMRGQHGNELAEIADTDFPDIWRGLMRRLGKIPEYKRLFEAAYPGTPFERMTFAHASNAIGGFLVDQFSSLDTPWDRFLDGNDRALSKE